MGTRYVTTPIYYVNAEPHVGHAYTNLATDTLARFYRLRGHEVFFLTGTDEHGEKIERAARDNNESPEQLVNRVVTTFQTLWEDLKSSHDNFIQTTDPAHQRGVQEIFRILHDQGDIYKDVFEGPFCVPCESYWTENQLNDDGTCPECDREVEQLSEDSYFFRLTDYVDDLRKCIENDPDFGNDPDQDEPCFKIRPESRRNEVINQIESDDVRDLSVSRSRFDWGVPVPFDEDHVIYVWFDALINYLTGIGFPDSKYKKWWPADVHVIGKDILRFHAVIWPCLLMALDDALEEDVKLPKRIHAHGWWTLEGEKISKSKGNAVDPRELTERYGRDAFRFFLLHQIPFGEDGTMSDEAIVEVINGCLANDLGNLVSRVLGMIEQYRDGVIPKDPEKLSSLNENSEINESIMKLKMFSGKCLKKFISEMENLSFFDATRTLINYVNYINKRIQNEMKPWELDDSNQQEKEVLNLILLELARSINRVAYLSYPIMPETAEKIWERLDLEPDIKTRQNLTENMEWKELEGGENVSKGSALFPRRTT